MHHSSLIFIVMGEALFFLYGKIVFEIPPIDGLCVEVKLMWLINCSYNPNKSMRSQHTEALGKNRDLYSSTSENFIFLVDFNAGMEHSDLKAHSKV